MWKTKPHGYWSEKLQSMAWSVSPPLPPPPSWWYLLLLLGDIWSFFHLEMLAPLALEYICYYLWISTAPTWWCLHFLIYRWYLPMLLCDICPCYLMIFAHATLWYLPMLLLWHLPMLLLWHLPMLLDDICEHCWIFKYVACRRPSEFHQSKRVVPRCGQILVFGLSHAVSQPRSRSDQRTQSFHHSYWCSMFNTLYSMYNVQCSVDAQFSILKIRPTHTIVPSLALYHTW